MTEKTKGVQFQHTLWFSEELSDHQIAQCAVGKVLYTGKSEFQTVEVYELLNFGTTLVIDGKIQSCTSDERLYHESLIHPALLAHPSPKRVLIGGGGEGATAREILRHNTVEKVTMVDIDTLVVNVSREHLTQHHAGSFNNPRYELVIQDAMVYLQNAQANSFDVIVMDLADPLPGGPCYLLYTKSFYEMAKSKLSKGGIFVTQTGPCGLTTAKDVCIPVNRTMKTVFKHVYTYISHVPSFSDLYSFCIGSDEIDVATLKAEEVDKLIEERIDATHETINWAFLNGKEAKGKNCFEHYDGITHISMFTTPKWYREQVENDKRDIITEDNPVYIQG